MEALKQPTKNKLYLIVLVLLVLFLIELGAQFLWWVRYGQPFSSTAAPQIFNARPFTMSANDARGVTLRPDFEYTYPVEETVWHLSTDSNGFRRSLRELNPEALQIVFVGDSVPFGWGVNDDQTLPSKIQYLLGLASDPRGILNAAIPSYSLAQAVARFEHEIAGHFTVDVLYLQIYEPVGRLVYYGRDWQPGITWTNSDRNSVAFNFTFPALKYSASAEIIRRFINVWLRAPTNEQKELDPSDSTTLERFREHLRGTLERLHKTAKESGVRRIVVAPLTAPLSNRAQWSNQIKLPVDTLNEELLKFSKENKDVQFLDTISLLDRLPEQHVFLDDCCHLTPKGNAVVAEALLPLLK